MSRLSTYGSRFCTAGMIGFLAIVPGAGSVCAQNLNYVVRDLNRVLRPNDAQRLEYQAYQNGRSDEQRYWHDYGAGLASSNPYRQYYRPDPGDERRYSARGGYGDWDYGSSRSDYPADRQ